MMEANMIWKSFHDAQSCPRGVKQLGVQREPTNLERFLMDK